MDELVDRIQREIDCGSLAYLWKIRKFISQTPQTDLDQLPPDFLENIRQLAIGSFECLKKCPLYTLDLSLQTLTQICQSGCRNLVTCEDPSVTILSKHFNKMINSSRTLLKCYDCGTVARAMFLGLIRAHRTPSDKYHKAPEGFSRPIQGHPGLFVPRNPFAVRHSQDLPPISPEELDRMRHLYNPGNFPVQEALKMLEDALLTVPVGTVFICSISLADSAGHVWVIEKFTTKTGTPAFRMFQSCLNSFLLLDQIADEGYLIESDRQINIQTFMKDLHRLAIPHDWTCEDYITFCHWFRFRCRGPIRVTDDTNICFTYVTYNDLN